MYAVEELVEEVDGELAEGYYQQHCKDDGRGVEEECRAIASQERCQPEG